MFPFDFVKPCFQMYSLSLFIMNLNNAGKNKHRDLWLGFMTSDAKRPALTNHQNMQGDINI